MNNGLKNLGQILKDKRKEKNLSLKSLSLKLKISVSILEAIEEAKTHRLPAFVYLRGFILAYGKALDLDERELLGEIQGLKPSLGSGEVSREEEEFIRGSGLKPSSIFPALGILFVLAVVLVVANIVRGLRSGQSPPAVVLNPPSPPQKEKSPHPVPRQAGPAPPAHPPRPLKEQVEIVVKAFSEVKLFYRLDEGETKSLSLAPDQFEVFKGQKTIWIETQDSDQVEIFKNGKSLGLFGSGGVSSRSFTAKGSE